MPRPSLGSRHSLWSVAALACVVLAGCAGPASSGTPQDSLVEAAPGIWLANGAGAVAGRVVSDAGLPLPDARISILGSDHFGRTDGQGSFLFVNVTVGAAELHVAADNFQAQAVELEVPDQGLVEVNVTMLPEASAGAGYLPHVHDLWAGEETYGMIDQMFDMTTRSSSGAFPDAYYVVVHGVYRPLTNVSRWVVPLAEAPDDNRPIVLPGTKTMGVRLTWDDPALDALGLCMRAPGGNDRCHGPKPSPATWTLPVEPGQADGGHARWTLWNMQVYHPPAASTARPATALNDIHVQIDLTRGHVPVDPPHPDFWADGDVLVHDDQHTDTSTCCGNHYGVRPDAIIPPGTQRLRIEHSWEFRGAGAGPLDFDYQLLVRTGAMNPHTTPVGQYLEPEPVEGDAAAMRKLYELELDAADTDAYYQDVTTWHLVLWNPMFEKEDFHAQSRPTVHALHITAHQ